MSLTYHTFGEVQPRLLIISGLHGDEGGVIAPLFEVLQKYKEHLPSFVFVPEMSNTALQKKTRKNQRGNDLNRMFGLENDDPEVRLGETLVHHFAPYDVVISFHEDVEYQQTYFYDRGERFFDIDLEKWRQRVREMDIELLEGIDDVAEPTLGHMFQEGYHYSDITTNKGSIEDWVLEEGLAKTLSSIK